MDCDWRLVQESSHRAHPALPDGASVWREYSWTSPQLKLERFLAFFSTERSVMDSAVSV